MRTVWHNLRQKLTLGTGESQVAIGTDMVWIPDIAASVARFGDRYLKFIYTDLERQYCQHQLVRGAFHSYATRYAAKEAVMKILRPGRDELMNWREIEVYRDGAEFTQIRLFGHAANKSAKLRFKKFSVSLCHERDFATAVVVGVR